MSVAFADYAHTVATHVLSALPADVPNPGQGELPPGAADKVMTLLKWGAGLAVAGCVGGFIYAGAKMAFAHSRGDSANLGRLGWVAAGCVVVGSASAFATALI